MKIDQLLVMQDGLRPSVDFESMIEFVRSGGIYTPEVIQQHKDKSGIIVLVRFGDDGKLAIHDGHHRVGSIWLSGVRDYLDESEYFIKDSTYTRYNTPNFDIGWVTPFDPRTEVRIADFGDFKRFVVNMAKTDIPGAIDYIKKNKSVYSRKRRYKDIRGMVADFDFSCTLG